VTASYAFALAAASLIATASLAATVHAQAPCANIDATSCPLPINAESARGLALGTGLRASGVSTSALAYSPGAIAAGKLYHLEGNVDYLADPSTVALGGAAIDSSTSQVGAGLALRGFLSGDDGFGGLDGRLALGLPISDAISIGLLGRYIDIEHKPSGSGADGFTMDAGLRIVPTQGLQLDLTAQNFIDLDSPYVPTLLNASLAFAAGESLSLGIDVLTDMTSFDNAGVTVGGGIEFLAGQSLPLRAGYMLDVERELHVVSGGLGYTDNQMGLDLSLRQQVSGGDDTRIMGAIRYYVQ
jgi:hypothetical protein